MKQKSMIAILLILTLLSAQALAQPPVWKLLGKRTVKLSTDRDVIHVGADEGTFRSIKLKVRKSGVRFKDMKVHFSNGDVFDVKIRKLIPAGGETRVIDLPGVNRNIKKVVFWYESTERTSLKASVRLWGKR